MPAIVDDFVVAAGIIAEAVIANAAGVNGIEAAMQTYIGIVGLLVAISLFIAYRR